MYFKWFDVLPFEYVYRKIIILFIIENFESYLDMKNIKVKRDNRSFDVKIEYSGKAFGQQFVDYLGPKNYNLMPVNIKREIFYTEGNRLTTDMKKKNSVLVIFNTRIKKKK